VVYLRTVLKQNERNSTVAEKYRFKAKIEGTARGAFVLFPFDVMKEFGTKGRVPIGATFNGVEYRGSLVKYGAPQHMVGLLKGIQEQIKKEPGDVIDVVIWKDEEERIVEVPPDFERLLANTGLRRAFEELSYTHRKEYCRWITEAKKEETRANRLIKAVEMLRAGVKTPG
jgi:hypothetical protein